MILHSRKRSGKPRSAKLAVILTLIQTWRIGGIIFVKGAYEGWLPAAFGFVAGWGDVLVGATSPIIAYILATRRGLGAWVIALVWNSLGITDLVVAISVGVLSRANAMREFPLVLVPTFFVPLLVIAHGITTLILARESSKRYFLGTSRN